jgi:hypothetical protein
MPLDGGRTGKEGVILPLKLDAELGATDVAVIAASILTGKRRRASMRKLERGKSRRRER